jgi:pyruvate/2-oxoglutarate dehydrogenase complex dihydrolipoamide acyltransferase (E2) component
MSTDILLPKLGFSMSEGQVAEWLVADGKQVMAGQPLFSLESDKSVTEIEAPATGILKILVQPEETCPVGTILGTIE